MSDDYAATLLCDFYKVSHYDMYPEGTEVVYSGWTPRGSRLKGVDRVVAFGFQAFIQRYLIDYFNEHFFSRPKDEVVAEYVRILRNTLGIADPRTSHIEALWDLGYLPLEIKAIAEGTLVPVRAPMVTIVNTRPEFFWLTNYIETIFSNECWMPSTSATVAHEFRKLLDKYAEMTGGDPTAVAFQGHDFSMRGMSSLQAAAASGAGHLLSFTGTDTIPAILFHEKYYGANTDVEMVGASIPASEHSVMCSYMEGGELELFRHLIEDVHPSGFVSIVSDTWDLFRVLTEYLPALKDKILARDGRVVIRPDSGDPVDIITGTNSRPGAVYEDTPQGRGVIECLWDIFGGTVNEKGYKVLDPHIGAIYGDSITLERTDAILSRLEQKGFASTNIVLGIGSYTYQFTTRDVFEFALKATSVTVKGIEKAISKDPATDTNHMKRSLKGRMKVTRIDGTITVTDGLTSVDHDPDDLLETVFKDGVLTKFQTLGEIRARLAAAA